ncbi:hypothetical protein PVIIG_02586 [Plasmodium vivax India VII]|uniref:Uncharacterized protein n=3 Tax=Plasmodium vivax TaxID=5855 RepID=A5K6Z1_PLAVS|nr:hypothetical protein PVX_099800 [Plasmodium vivax]EDL45082.1 hypothetical protein PVX_099800 [Plasmodium vivax]KMZ81104.1 hypothetical protein PVIIG_02586 [Plasmodium vivax India VII]KMZ93778.1 hypothetical protein PVMG_05031 [Plasmodium vivax Mauritania I]|eukprot:XP_001614809.1 hypothetical protein [Plasmodium vivax Sal-1]
MKNILMGKTSLYCTPNCSGVDANGEGIENGGIYNSRERNLPKEDPSGELGRTEELHKMLMNDCANGMANYNIGDFFFLKNEGEHLNGLTYLHGENALQGRVNSFGDNTNLDGMCQVNYGGLSGPAVGFTRRIQQSAAVEGGPLNGASLHGGFGRGSQGEHQNQAYRNDCCGQEERTQVAMYSHPNRLMGTQRDHSPMNQHIDSYELAYKTDESFTNYVHNAGREVAKRGEANSVAENGRGGQNEEGLSDGSNQDNENPPRSYNPLTYSFSGLCECLARGEEEEGVDVVDVVEEEEEA